MEPPNQARLVPMENRVSEVEQRTKAGGRWPVAVGQGIAESKMFWERWKNRGTTMEPYP